MRRTSAHHLDNRRHGLPRDYVNNPWLFGTETAVLVMPAGGDEDSAAVAWEIHNLVRYVEAHRIPGAAICREMHMGRDVWTEVKKGRRWPGETVLIALIRVIRKSQAGTPTRAKRPQQATPSSTSEGAQRLSSNPPTTRPTARP